MSKFSVHVLSPGNDAPFPPFVQITVSEYSADNNGNIFVTPQLATESEIDHHIDLLIEQLKTIRKEAKKKLHKK